MTKPKSRLGRGLSSLIGTIEATAAGHTTPPPSFVEGRPALLESTPQADEMFHVELSQVRVNPFQPRRHFDADSLSLLAASMKASGLIQPIVVKKVDGGYELIAGERRYRAALEAGLDRLPAVVREANPGEQAEWALIENIHRQDLNPIDRAEAYARLVHEFGLTQEALATRLGEDRSTIANHLRLLKLTESVRRMVVDGSLSLGHAKILAGIDDQTRQKFLADEVVSKGLSVRKLEDFILPPAVAVAPLAAVGKTQSVKSHLADVENRLTQRLQMRVQLKTQASGKKGRVVIHYGSLDQFDQLMEKLGVVLEAD